MTHLRQLAILLPLLFSPACVVEDPVGPNPWAGCYDTTCVGAPVAISGVPPLVSISSLGNHTCGLTAEGEAWCWGDNGSGQLGDGTDVKRNAPVKVASELRFSTIVTGLYFTCALTPGNATYCWGGAFFPLQENFGDRCGPQGGRCAKAPQLIPAPAFKAIAAGYRHVCALDLEGAAYCWGSNFSAESGSTNLDAPVRTPTRVPGSQLFTRIGAGDAYNCALRADGRAYCWGGANRGELGTSAPECGSVFGFVNHCSPTPLPVNTAARFASLSVGNSHVCALAGDGAAWCWGDNGQAQLGARHFMNVSAPVVAHQGNAFSTINASTAVTCATPQSGPSVCWGLNLMGKLGIGSRLELSVTPLAIAGDREYVALAGGSAHLCGLTVTGAVFCWGSNEAGQLGVR